jgi:hypothetical protein
MGVGKGCSERSCRRPGPAPHLPVVRLRSEMLDVRAVRPSLERAEPSGQAGRGPD